MTTPETVPAIDDDRIAYLALNHLPSKYRADIMAGEWDNVTGMQVLARHRIAATRDLEAEVERLKAEKHQLTMRGLFLSEKYKREICGLEAQLAEARELLERIKESDEASIKEMAAMGIDLPDSSGLFAREIAAFLSRTGGEGC